MFLIKTIMDAIASPGDAVVEACLLRHEVMINDTRCRPTSKEVLTILLFIVSGAPTNQPVNGTLVGNKWSTVRAAVGKSILEQLRVKPYFKSMLCLLCDRLKNTVNDVVLKRM